MKRLMLFSVFLLFLAGCFTYVKEYPQNPVSAEKSYPRSTAELKEKLARDLRSGALKLGQTADEIRSAYGDADNLFVFEYLLRLVYKLDEKKKVILWFEDGVHLSTWSD